PPRKRGDAPTASPPRCSNGLIECADLLEPAQHRVLGLELVAHARLRYWAFDRDDELRLVGRCTDKAPAAVLNGDADTVYPHEIANRLAGDFLVGPLSCLEMSHHIIHDAVLYFVGAMRRHGWRLPRLRQRVLEIGHLLVGIAIKHVAHREREDEAVIVTAAIWLVEKEMAGLLESGERAELVNPALDVGMAGLPIVGLCAMLAQNRIGE